MSQTIKDVSKYLKMQNSNALIEQLILKDTNQVYLEDAFQPKSLDDVEFNGLQVSLASDVQETEPINGSDYFLHQAKVFNGVPLIKNNFLSENLIYVLDFMDDKALFFSKRDAGNIFSDGVSHNAFFISEQNDLLCDKGYIGVLASGIKKEGSAGDVFGDLSLILGSYIGDGKFSGKFLEGIRLNTFDALKAQNQDLTSLRSDVFLTNLKHQEEAERFANFVDLQGYERSEVDILTPKRIEYR